MNSVITSLIPKYYHAVRIIVHFDKSNFGCITDLIDGKFRLTKILLNRNLERNLHDLVNIVLVDHSE